MIVSPSVFLFPPFLHRLFSILHSFYPSLLPPTFSLSPYPFLSVYNLFFLFFSRVVSFLGRAVLRSVNYAFTTVVYTTVVNAWEAEEREKRMDGPTESRFASLS